MRKSITIAAHDVAGQFSVERTIESILNDYWFPQLKRYVKQHINTCTYKKHGGKRPVTPYSSRKATIFYNTYRLYWTIRDYHQEKSTHFDFDR